MPGDPFYRSKAWYRLRHACLVRDNYKCTNCGADVRAKGAARVDHIKTRREYPALALVLSNVRTLCARCDNSRHSEKGGKESNPVGLDGYPPGW